MVAASSVDDSDAARLAAIARLRAAPPSTVCDDPALNSRSYGTSCESREFRAPAIVEAPRIRWEVEFGWWGTWSLWIGEGLMLTGSCNNDTNKGLSAIDMQTGKVRWRNAAICDVGARAGTMGNANFQEYGPGQVFFGLSRVDGKPVDLHIVDLKTGRIIEMLAPVKRGPTNEVGGVVTVITASKEAKRTYLKEAQIKSTFARPMTLHSFFRLRCVEFRDSRFNRGPFFDLRASFKASFAAFRATLPTMGVVLP